MEEKVFLYVQIHFGSELELPISASSCSVQYYLAWKTSAALLQRIRVFHKHFLWKKMKEWKVTSLELTVRLTTRAFVENWKGWAQMHAQLYFQIGIGNLWDNAEADFRVAMSLIVADRYTRRYVIFIKLAQLNLGFAVDEEDACNLIILCQLKSRILNNYFVGWNSQMVTVTLAAFGCGTSK